MIRFGRILWSLASIVVPFQLCWIAPAEARSTSASSVTTNGSALPPISDEERGPSQANLTNPAIKEYCNAFGLSNNGIDCPCGNVLPAGSSTGCENRSGVGASLTTSGNASIANDTLVLTATGMSLNAPGYFLRGSGTRGASPFGNGVRCISGPFVRLRKVGHSSGLDTYPAPNTPPISVQLNLTVGSKTFFQVMYRDLGGPCGSSKNMTNAVMVIWGT